MRRDRRPGRRVLWRLAACASALLGPATLTPGAASGIERPTGVVLFDGPGDVHDVDYPLDDADPPDLVGAVPTADILRATVTHAPYAVRIRMRFTDLRRANPNQQSYGVSVRSPHGAYRLFLIATPRARSGQHHLSRLLPTGQRPVRCPGLTHLIRYRTDVVRFRIPRSCLQQPRWVRVQLTSFMSRDLGDEAGPHYVDNPHNRLTTDSAPPPLTAPLYRG